MAFFHNDLLHYVWNFGTFIWSDTTGNYVIWSGEIGGRESDMPGTSNYPCYFEDCKYALYNHTYMDAANFYSPPDQIFTLDTTEWMIEFVEGYNNFKIWDVYPQP